MFPEIPSDLKSLSATALRTLAKEIKTVALSNLKSATLSDEDSADIATHLAQRDELIALAARKDADAKLAADLEGDDSDDEPVVPKIEDQVQVPGQPNGQPANEDAVNAVTPGDAPNNIGLDPVTPPSGEAASVVTQFGMPSAAAVVTRAPRLTVDYLKATDGVQGKKAGDGYENWAELTLAAMTKAESIRSNSSEKFEVARLKAQYPKERILSEDVNFNMARFEPDELTAALCAPATPYYNLACMNTLRRPVFASLPQFQAPRMKVSIMSSPTLASILPNTGVGVWTAANEASANDTKNPCATITCGSPTEYQMYGVYRCLTVRNMLAMSYPELVEAYLNRLGAAHSRLAEVQLLNAMATGATSITAPTLGYGASTTITSTILNYLALYQEQQRWDEDGPFEAWMPRWVLYGMKMDLVRRNTNGGNFNLVPSDAQIESIFANAGINVHWFIDTPTWSVAIPSVATGSVLNRLPATVQILLAKRGKFAVMDRGELAIGVTGNGIYRDNASNARNEFTFFFENFEGIVNTDSCPAHLLDVPVCWNGAQAEAVLVNCQGGDEVGYQS